METINTVCEKCKGIVNGCCCGSIITAEFMGFKLERTGFNYKMTFEGRSPYSKRFNWITEYNNHLHWDWNTLMPVVKKINELPLHIISQYFREGTTRYKFDMDRDIRAFYHNDLPTVYESAVEFIKWYNEQDKTE